MEFKRKIKNIADHYHDRLCLSGLYMDNQVCECCGNVVNDTTSIEHDTQDHSKDLSICFNCYKHVVEYWKINKPKKLPPVEY